MFHTNTDPKKRFVSIFEVSQNSSLASKMIVDYIPFSVLEKDFENSESISSFFNDPKFIGWCLIICLYKTPTGEVRRRILKSETMPKENEDLFNLMKMTAESVGVTISFHESKITSKEFKLNGNEYVKEKDIFLYSMIDLFCGGVSDKPFDQLVIVKEFFLNSAVEKKEMVGHIVGGFLQSYIEERNNLYKIAKTFGDQLSRADLKLSSEYIPTRNEPLMIEFPFVFKFGNFYIRNAIISIMPLSETGAKGLTVVCPKIYDGKWNGDMFFTTLNCETSDDIQKSLDSTEKFFSNSQSYRDLISFVLKSLIYIHSEESDIQRQKGLKTSKKNVAKIKTFYKHNNPFDIINVGFGFHGRVYSVSKTLVSGHFRWQPCGKGLSQVKLIWIDEHPRNYSP